MLNAIINYLNGGAIAATGAHALTPNKVMRPTDPHAITPANPGQFDSIRSVPVCPSPRYFDKREADVLTDLAKKLAAGAKETTRAYKALADIEQADQSVHVGHRQYQGTVADAELAKKKADYALADKLHGQRPQYAQMGYGLRVSERKADQAIAKIRAKLEAVA